MNKKLFSGFISIFFVILIAINTLGGILLLDRIIVIKNDIKSLKNEITTIDFNTVREENISEAKIIEFYEEISEKSSEAIDRILTIVAIVASIVTFFSLLLAFKAPHDINKRIDELKSNLLEAKESSEEAKYQALISSAMAKEDRYAVIRKLTDIIHKYPQKPDAYLIKGFMYDDLKKYDLAINEYKNAKKYKCEMSTYYNAMGVAYSNKNNNKKAITFYSKAIEIDPECASFYCNRACSYQDEAQYEQALNDYDKAIEIDEDCFEAYFNRNYVYDELWRKEKDSKKRLEYIEKRKADLEKAIDLNPDNDTAPKILKQFINELIEKDILKTPEQVIAKIDEKIADINIDIGKNDEAFNSYTESIDYYAKEVIINKKEFYQKDFNRLKEKIINLILNKKESDNIKIDKYTSPVVINELSKAAIEKYIKGNKKESEILFRAILPLNGSSLNLAFMKRRNETENTEESVLELLNMDDEQTSAIWCINKALCYVDGPEEKDNWSKAIDIVKKIKFDIENAVNWWRDIKIVGEKENNIVFLLLHFANIYHDDNYTPEQRISLVERYGYIIPEEIKI